jgi:thiamine-phosphate pyrophosphorylase
MSRSTLARPIIMAVSDRHQFDSDDGKACDRIVTWSVAVARAGVDLIQIRERGLDDRRLLALVRRVCAATTGYATRVVVNERTDIALAGEADGVHLPGTAPPAGRVRAVVPARFLIGRSVHIEAEAMQTELEGGCDYVMFGTVFSSASKPAGHPIAGISALAAVCRRVKLPVVAIGGIDEARANDAARAGAAGIAAIGLFAAPMPASEPEPVTRSRFDHIVRTLRHAFDAQSAAARSTTSG